MNMEETAAALAVTKLDGGDGAWLVRSLNGVEEYVTGRLEVHGDLGLLTVTDGFERPFIMNLGALEVAVPLEEVPE